MTLNYKVLKKELLIETVLDKYGYLDNLKRSSDKLYGACPIHGGDSPKAFNVSLDKNLWNCFTYCGGGSVIDLIMTIEMTDFLDAILIGDSMLGGQSDKKIEEYRVKPLNFTLDLIPEHPYLGQRNLKSETIEMFGVGYCDTGIMSGRIAIPIHDTNNNLVAYCGRAVDDSEPKYLFPKGFQKNKVVYNLNRVKRSKAGEIAIVEGFFDVFSLWQAGIESVALMGSSMSYHQKRLLSNLENRLTLLFDGDEAGKKGMQTAAHMLSGIKPVKAIYLPNDTQPEDLSRKELRELIQ